MSEKALERPTSAREQRKNSPNSSPYASEGTVIMLEREEGGRDRGGEKRRRMEGEREREI